MEFTQAELELLAQTLNTAICSRSYSRDKVDALNALADKVVSMQEPEEIEDNEPDYSCTNPNGHDFVLQGEDEMRSALRCCYCGADGDA